MAKEAYIGITNKARRAKNLYIGVNGKSRRVLKGYIGVDGKSKLFYQYTPPKEYVTLTFDTYSYHASYRYLKVDGAPLTVQKLVVEKNVPITISTNTNKYIHLKVNNVAVQSGVGWSCTHIPSANASISCEVDVAGTHYGRNPWVLPVYNYKVNSGTPSFGSYPYELDGTYIKIVTVYPYNDSNPTIQVHYYKKTPSMKQLNVGSGTWWGTWLLLNASTKVVNASGQIIESNLVRSEPLNTVYTYTTNQCTAKIIVSMTDTLGPDYIGYLGTGNEGDTATGWRITYTNGIDQ